MLADQVSSLTSKLTPGTRVRATQFIHGRAETWSSRVEGVVEACRPEATGSWFAHGKNDRLWLLRLRLRKDDGEVASLVIDQNSEVTVLETTEE
jgi:hypothetical protein